MPAPRQRRNDVIDFRQVFGAYRKNLVIRYAKGLDDFSGKTDIVPCFLAVPPPALLLAPSRSVYEIKFPPAVFCNEGGHKPDATADVHNVTGHQERLDPLYFGADSVFVVFEISDFRALRQGIAFHRV